ncbi:hypothetical protein [Sphingomonas sp. R86520]|uniref:hypothetical protein n=1 Tax=Sphingomonas sp. R86520 TaxID=3093859 RepID=UPI0036D29D63
MKIEQIEGVIRDGFYQALGSNAENGLITLDHGSVLLESGLDSLGFAVLVSHLEDDLGWDPFTLSDTPYYPQTFGEFVSFYASNQP